MNEKESALIYCRTIKKSTDFLLYAVIDIQKLIKVFNQEVSEDFSDAIMIDVFFEISNFENYDESFKLLWSIYNLEFSMPDEDTNRKNTLIFLNKLIYVLNELLNSKNSSGYHLYNLDKFDKIQQHFNSIIKRLILISPKYGITFDPVNKIFSFYF